MISSLNLLGSDLSPRAPRAPRSAMARASPRDRTMRSKVVFALTSFSSPPLSSQNRQARFGVSVRDRNKSRSRPVARQRTAHRARFLEWQWLRRGPSNAVTVQFRSFELVALEFYDRFPQPC